MRRRLVAILAVLTAGAAACSAATTASVTDVHPTTSAPGTATTNVATRSAPDDNVTVVRSLGLKPDEVAAGYEFADHPGGLEEGTLSVCGASFPSEQLRVHRHQVGIRTAKSDPLGTEAVLYRDAAAAEQAMDELRSAIGSCPSVPVAVRPGAPEWIWQLQADPDRRWTTVPGVERVAMDVTLRSTKGRELRMQNIYLRRGRVLLGIYVEDPDHATEALASHEPIEALTNRLSNQLASLPGDLTS